MPKVEFVEADFRSPTEVLRNGSISIEKCFSELSPRTRQKIIMSLKLDMLMRHIQVYIYKNMVAKGDQY